MCCCSSDSLGLRLSFKASSSFRFRIISRFRCTSSSVRMTGLGQRRGNGAVRSGGPAALPRNLPSLLRAWCRKDPYYTLKTLRGPSKSTLQVETGFLLLIRQVHGRGRKRAERWMVWILGHLIDQLTVLRTE